MARDRSYDLDAMLKGAQHLAEQIAMLRREQITAKHEGRTDFASVLEMEIHKRQNDLREYKQIIRELKSRGDSNISVSES
jgi:hypothetical protein